MPITTDIDTIWTEKEQRDDFFAGRASLESITSVLREQLVRFAAIKASGSFNTLPTSLKQAMLRWETLFQTAQTAYEADTEIVDIFDWRP